MYDQEPVTLHSISLFSEEEEAPLLDAEILTENNRHILADAKNLTTIFLSRLDSPKSETDESIEWPDLSQARGPYAALINRLQLVSDERLLLILALLPHFAPSELTNATKSVRQGLLINHALIGGYVHPATLNYIPNIRTLLFLSAGADYDKLANSFMKSILSGRLMAEQIISLKSFGVADQLITESDLIPQIATEYVHHLLYGREARPDFGEDFPAEQVTTALEWDKHIFLPEKTRTEVLLLRDTIAAVSNAGAVNPNLAKGLPALLYGPPGTGKTLTAVALGKMTGYPVFRIDLARIVSKYVGETEKRLALVFERAEGKNWILFFDEADVLFGKRTGVGDAHDRYANLLTAYLLQRMEDYRGVSLLSTNFKDNIDPAMGRRFLYTIFFPEPTHEERMKIWETAIPKGFTYEDGLKVKTLAQAELTGAQINTILKLAALRGAKRNDYKVLANDLKYFAILEYGKKRVSSKVRNWPNEQLLGFGKPLPLEDPTLAGRVHHVSDLFSFANINLFE